MKTTTTTSFFEATSRLAVFGAKGVAYGAGLVAGSTVAVSDALGEHINSAPESWSAGINNRSISQNASTAKAVSYRGTRRIISGWGADDSANAANV